MRGVRRHAAVHVPITAAAGPVRHSISTWSNISRDTRTALIIATKIKPRHSGLPLSESENLLRPERISHEKLLLDLERHYDGRAFSYAGRCLYCPNDSCARLEGRPCRHPELVRPSLEACGFDLCRTTEELMAIPLRWGEGDRMPEYLTLVSGFFHNADRIDMNDIWKNKMK